MVYCRAIAGAVCLLAAAGCLTAADADPAGVLTRVIAQVLATGRNLPNYTCVETVTRDSFRPAAATLPRACSVILAERQHPTLDMVLRPYATDRLRLDVTLVKDGEILSWAGASRFRDGHIDRLVPNGPIGTGAFGAFLMVVFQQDISKFTYAGYRTADGRTLVEYSFAVPASESTYSLRFRDSSYVTAFSGTFLADPETNDLVRLTVATGELPLAAETCEITATLDYSMVRIGDFRSLLPAHVRQRWVNPDGSEAENNTAFTACREYTGESTITFGPESTADPAGTAGNEPAAASPVPAGLRFAMALTSPIPTDTAAAGDRFQAQLIEPLRDAKSKILAPKGAVVEGRLLRVQRYYHPPHAVVVFRPQTVEVKGAKVPLAASRDWGHDVGEGPVEIDLPRSGEDRSGGFSFAGKHTVVPHGFRSYWHTAAAAQTGSTPPQ
jgi:hypothetical protein